MIERLHVVCFKWQTAAGYRSEFNATCVNVLFNMVQRHYAERFEFVCVTDDDDGIDPMISVEPLWDDWADVPSPHGGNNPSCYRRLKLFSPEAEKLIGRRMVAVDLDTIIVRDVTEMWNDFDEFRIWAGQWDPTRAHNQKFNGSLIGLTAGARREVWDRFEGFASSREQLKAGFRGSDQGWINYVLHTHKEQLWTMRDGIYSWRVDLKPRAGALPPDARMVMFHGAEDPWSIVPQRMTWVRDNWR